MSWYLEKMDDSIFVKINGFRLSNRKGEQVGEIVEALCGKNADEILFRFKDEVDGKRLSRSLFVSPNPGSFSERLVGTKKNAEFLTILTDATGISKGQTKKRKIDTTSDSSCKKILMPDIQPTDVESCHSVQAARNPVDMETENCYIGRYEVSVMTLSPPPSDLKCRDLNRTWVQQIKEGLKSSTTGTYVTLPCLVDINELSNRDDFEPERLALYTKYTLGGNHVRSALQEYLQETDDRHLESLRRVSIDLYAGLTNYQARRLGNLHNAKTATAKPTMMDAVRLCRRILYEMSECDMCVDDPPASSAIWKARCQMELAEENKSLNSLTTIFHLALYSRRCWAELEKIAQAEVSRAHDGRCDLKQPAFQKLQGLSESYRYELLKKVASGELTLAECGREADVTKKMALIKSTFNKLTHCTSWDEAREKYPYHTVPDRLKEKFLATRFDRKHVPQDFARWCADAVKSPSSTLNTGSLEEIDVDITVSVRGQLNTEPSVSRICDKYRQKIKQEIAKLKDVLTDSLDTPSNLQLAESTGVAL